MHDDTEAMPKQEKTLGFWSKLGCYFDVVFWLTWIFFISFYVLGNTIEHWSEIISNGGYRVVYTFGWAILFVIYIMIWKTCRDSVKKLLKE